MAALKKKAENISGFDPSTLPNSNDGLKKFLDSSSLCVEVPTMELICRLFLNCTYVEWVSKLPDQDKPRNTRHPLAVQDHGFTDAFMVPQSSHQTVFRVLGSAENEVWFFGNTLDESLDAPKTKFFEALCNGVSLRFLVLDTTADERLELLAQELGTNIRKAKRKTEDTIYSLLQLMKYLHQEGERQFVPEQFQVRITTNALRMRAYIVDPRNPNEKSYLIPSVNQKISKELPQLLCQNTPGGLVHTYFEGLHDEWEKAQTLHAFLRSESSQEFLAEFPSFFEAFPEVINPTHPTDEAR
ncbi:hypothetical protein [Leptolyngbya iicbica]|uniref:Uncharacterized protein n=2 Tax=Cyanophyceae TaxID=3028117 RepID=A0A4Q7E6G2_9CYAN|nr:hypothetical protein [Leptolyngbya sp. LK]RZM77793.1 hypothetical protein DYY88_14555 [Leptolyngbya sp. LK]